MCTPPGVGKPSGRVRTGYKGLDKRPGALLREGRATMLAAVHCQSASHNDCAPWYVCGSAVTQRCQWSVDSALVK